MKNTDYLRTLASRIELEGFGSGSHSLANLKEGLEIIADELESLEGLEIIADELESLSTKKKEKKP